MENEASYTVEMTQDDLMALHSVLNGLEAMDELFGENPERRRTVQQLGSLRKRLNEARALQTDEHSVRVS